MKNGIIIHNYYEQENKLDIYEFSSYGKFSQAHALRRTH
jgi:hypothetical protein